MRSLHLIGTQCIQDFLNLQLESALSGGNPDAHLDQFLFSGLHLQADRPFEANDTILFKDKYCRVQRVGLRSTWLYNIFDHDLIVVPNNMVANSEVVNLIRPDKRFRVRVDVGVAYGSPLDLVEEIILEAVRETPGIIMDEGRHAPFLLFLGFGDSSLDYMVKFWVEDVFEQWNVAHAVRRHIERRFREEDIAIPFPQRTLSFLRSKGLEGLSEAVRALQPPDRGSSSDEAVA